MTNPETRNLCYWLAENVMGWAVETGDYGQMICRDNSVAVYLNFFPTEDPDAALMVLEKCLKKVSELGVFDISMCLDAGADEPYVVCLNSPDDANDEICVDSCASAKTLGLAIALFARNLYSLKPRI